MTEALTKTTGAAAIAPLVPQTMGEALEFAQRLAKSQLLPADLRGKEADVFATIAWGLEMGVPPMSALRGVSIIKGKPFPHADLLMALCLQHPDCEFFRPVDDECIPGKIATFEAKRKSWKKPIKRSFSMEDAQRAKLTGRGDDSNWSKYPDRMLEARAKSIVARLAFPDRLHGVYTAEEAPEVVDGQTGEVFEAPAPAREGAIDVQPSEAPASQPASEPAREGETGEVQDGDAIDMLLERIELAETEAQLKALYQPLKKASDSEPARRTEVKERYNAKRKALRGAAA